MPGVCKKCGLPEDLCVCETLAREKDKITIYEEKKRYKKVSTFINGISKDVDSKQLLKDLKQKFACGGTIKDSILEIQGAHKHKVKAYLVNNGFAADQINVK